MPNQEEARALLDAFDSATTEDIAELRRKSRLSVEEFDKYMDEIRVDASDNKNSFHVLRRWSSDRYRLLRSGSKFPEEDLVGGGYVAKISGKLIAIDPGYDFFHNARTHGIEPSLIDYILISHNHPDHTESLKDFFILGRNKPVTRTLFCNANTLASYRYLANQSGIKPVVISANPPSTVNINSQISLDCKSTDHWELTVNDGDVFDTMGFVIRENGNPLIGYLSDSRDRSNLLSDYSGARLLVIHVGTAGKSKNHLGPASAIRVVKANHPNLTIVSEFDIDEFGFIPGLRQDITDVIEKGSGIPALPADIGLRLQFESGRILVLAKCLTCPQSHFVAISAVQVMEDTRRGILSFTTSGHE